MYFYCGLEFKAYLGKVYGQQVILEIRVSHLLILRTKTLGLEKSIIERLSC